MQKSVFKYFTLTDTSVEMTPNFITLKPSINLLRNQQKCHLKAPIYMDRIDSIIPT